MKAFRLAPLIAVLALAGCGGTSHKALNPGPSQTVSGHKCDPNDQVMQCVLSQLPGPPKQLQAAPPFAHGIDFAWSCPSPAGHDFGASYFSFDLSKNWTRACINKWHAAGKAVTSTWETSANRALAGYNAGFNDAWTDRHQARAVGWPDNRPMRFAIDFDATGPDVASYAQGFAAGDKAVTHIAGETDAYGGAAPLNYLCAHHLVGHQNWVTYAWLYRTHGVWPSAACAPLQQYLNSSTVDYDRAIAADYGQWPYVAPKPKPDLHYTYYATGKGSPDERATVMRYDVVRANPKLKRELPDLERALSGLAHRVYVAAYKDCCNGSFNLPPKWNVLHRGFRFQGLIKRAHGERLA